MPTGKLTVLAVLALMSAACTGPATQQGNPSEPLVVYSGRGEELVGPLVDRFREQAGFEVQVRYAGSTELAATLLEEGANSPADVFFAQDPASLGAVAKAGMLRELPDDVRELVPARFQDGDGRWVGLSGRTRVVIYNTDAVPERELPESIDDVTDPSWRGRIGVAPTNGSFLAFVAAMILERGEAATLAWLEGLAANQPVTYESNSSIVAAVDAGEVDAGLVNHYYLFRLRAEQGSVTAANLFLQAGDPGTLVMPAGVGILAGTDRPEQALELVRFLLSEEAQRYFAEETFEYPMVPGVAADPDLPPLEEIPTPGIDLSDLADTLDRATDLVAEAGLI